LSQDLEVTLFRIVQEGLTNIHRHSESPTAELHVSAGKRDISLKLVDQGKGIPAEMLKTPADEGSRVGVGLRGMRERVKQLGGKLEISSGPGGTTVTASLPLKV
jgi:signal transduction histidine kinase